MTKILVLLDTNALFMPFQFGINLETELERLLGDCRIVVPSAVKNELESLGGEKHSRAALRLSEKYENADCGDKPSVDYCIAELAIAISAVVVTSDRALQKIIIGKGGRVATLREKNHLVILPARKR